MSLHPIKSFYIQNNIGRSRYVVNHHDGEKKHPDGSDFFDISIAKNKKELARIVSSLKSKGYVEKQDNNINNGPDKTVPKGEYYCE